MSTEIGTRTTSDGGTTVGTKVRSERIAELDVFRGVAAVWVMLFHFMIRWFEQPGPPESPYGEYGVHLFFMISGFVIFMTLKNTKTGADFIVSRVSRLYPAYWAAVLITTAFMVIMPPFEKSSVTLPQVAVNLTMLQQWFRVKEVDGVYWTLAIELAFYGWMFVFFKLRALDRIERIGAVWILVSVVARAWERMQMAVPTLDPGIIPHVISRSLVLEHAHLFVAGMVFYRIRMDGPSKGRAALLGFSLLAQYFIHGPVSTPFLGIFFIIFLLIALRKLGWLSFRPLVFLGGISYSLYLVHQNIGYAVMRKLDGQAQVLQVTSAVTVSMLIAILLTYTIEKPCLRLVRRLWTAKKSGATTDAMSSIKTDGKSHD